jgi:hypothetical protein
MRSHGSSIHTGRLVLRLPRQVADRIPADLASLERLASAFGLRGLKETLGSYPPLPSYPAIRRDESAPTRTRAQPTDQDFPPAHSLSSYFLVDPRDWKDPGKSQQFLQSLKALSEVEVAYRELTVRPWSVDPDDPLVKDQGYLDAAPKGIGAAEVRGSFNGTGIGFVDLEAGWNLKHVDLPQAKSPQPMIHLNDKTQADHGTAVLGVVLGLKNAAGITGIAPGADFRGVASYVVSLTNDELGVADAIQKATEVLNEGDVLLLEVETGDGYPIETDELVFNAIRDAVHKGIIVIEAAGNGTEVVGRDLDKPIRREADDPPAVDLNRKSASFQDSGAIVVSACRANLASDGGHRRIRFANYWSRIDCYAWGEKVVTAGGGDFGPIGGANRRFTASFGGTSAAAAIIAGAAILAQQIATQPGGRGPLDPARMRAILSDPEMGTAILAPSGGKKIGVMPDLKKIAKRLTSA